MSNTSEWANKMNKTSQSNNLWKFQKDLEEKLGNFVDSSSIPNLRLEKIEGARELIFFRDLCRSLNLKIVSEDENGYTLVKQKVR